MRRWVTVKIGLKEAMFGVGTMCRSGSSGHEDYIQLHTIMMFSWKRSDIIVNHNVWSPSVYVIKYLTKLSHFQGHRFVDSVVHTNFKGQITDRSERSHAPYRSCGTGSCWLSSKLHTQLSLGVGSTMYLYTYHCHCYYYYYYHYYYLRYFVIITTIVIIIIVISIVMIVIIVIGMVSLLLWLDHIIY